MNNEVLEQEKIDYKLNFKQLAFADALVSGKTQREAYAIAGYRCKDANGIDSKASQLVSNSKIAKYVEIQRKKLQDKAQEELQLSQSERIQAYKKIISDCIAIANDENSDNKTKVAAQRVIKETQDSITRMGGYFNDKMQVTQTVIIRELEGLGLQKLKELAESLN